MSLSACSNCNKKSEGLKRCFGCRSILYCSRVCQVKDWKNHKKECFSLEGKRIEENVEVSHHEKKGRILRARRDFEAGECVFVENALMKYSGKHVEEKSAFWGDELKSNSLNAFTKLTPEKKKILLTDLYVDSSPSMLAGVETVVDSSKENLLKFGISEEDAIQLVLVLKFNSLNTSEKIVHLDSFVGISGNQSISKKRGKSIYVIHRYVSKISHSCSPNCNSYTDSTQNCICRVIAMKKIKKGSEITISYMKKEWLLYPTIFRRGHLSKSFCFECECERCMNPEEISRVVTCPKCKQTRILLSKEEENIDINCEKCAFKFPENVSSIERNAQFSIFKLDANPQSLLYQIQMRNMMITVQQLLDLFEKEALVVYRGEEDRIFKNHWGRLIVCSIVEDLIRVNNPSNLEKRISLNRMYIRILEMYMNDKQGFVSPDLALRYLKLASVFKKRKKYKKKAIQFYEMGLKCLVLYYGKEFPAVGEVEEEIKIISRK